MNAQILLRRGLAELWTGINPTLGDGEIGLENDTGKFKIGDGETEWNSLSYFQGEQGPEGPQGTQGPQGDPGIQGEPGPGITDIVFNPDGTLSITYGDPVAQTFQTINTTSLIGPSGLQGEPGQGLNISGTVADLQSLPTDNNETGDFYIALDSGNGYLWNGTAWIDTGPIRGPQGDQGVPGEPGPTDWDLITNKPTIPADISDLTDNTNLLGGGIDSEPTQLSFEAGEDEDLVSHSAGFVEGDPVFQIRLNTHLAGEEQVKWGFDTDSTLTLPAGGTVSEGVVTDNPTIELTPANPEVESQKLVIKGGFAGTPYINEENGIKIITYSLNVQSGDIAYFEVEATTYASETFFWWVDLYSPGSEFTPDNGTVTLNEFGFGNIEFTVNDDTVPLRIYVADALYNAYANGKGAVSVLVNDPDAVNVGEDLYHLHLTTGNLQESSVFLGTDEHNVRTKIDGSVELTSADYNNQNTYRLNFKNNVLRISSTADEGDEDLFIKAEDDLYLDALDDDVIVRANDDIRLRPGYDFEDGDYRYELRFTDNGELYFYNDNDGTNYGIIRMNEGGDENPKTLEIESDHQISILSNNRQYAWKFDETGKLILPNGDKIAPISTDNGLQIDVDSNFEIKVSQGEEEVAVWSFDSNGNLTFPDGDVQTTAYAGGNGRMMFIDTNRTGDYTANGSADKPFKTFAAAIAAAEESDATAFTFVLMGCTVTEDVDFTNTTFTQITISTACRSVISGNITIASIPTLSQLVIRNIEVGGTFTLTGDGTSEQMNNCSFYNASFSGAVNITATNATAFYEAAFFGAVNFTNLSYLYINGAQFNADWTITADSDGVIPSRGINPGTGGSIAIVFGTIANNVIFVKGGTAAYVFQPHMSRMGLGAGTYTIPAGWTVTPHSSVLRGTWVNNGTLALRNSSHDNPIGGSAPSYVGSIGAASLKFQDGTTQTTAYTGIVWSITSSGAADYVFNGPGIESGNTNDPVLYLYRGFTYTFVNTTGSNHPFAIRESNGGADYTRGVSGSQTGTQTFTVPMDAPSTLYYQCTLHSSMGNVINIL